MDVYQSYFGALTCLAWSPDGRYILVCCLPLLPYYGLPPIAYISPHYHLSSTSSILLTIFDRLVAKMTSSQSFLHGNNVLLRDAKGTCPSSHPSRSIPYGLITERIGLGVWARITG